MNHWPTKSLGEVAQVTAGDPAPQRPEDFSDDGVPFVRMQDVGRFGQTTCLAATKDHISASASAKLKQFPVGSILVPKSGASIRLNHRAILGIRAHVVSHLAVIVPHPSLNTNFAYYWLCATDLSGVAHQADLPSMKTSDLARLRLPVPPLSEQERIVKLLSEADELRKLRTQADNRTATLISALFHKMFGDPEKNTTCCRSAMLGEIISSTKLGLVRGANEMDDTLPFPYIRMDAILGNGNLILTPIKRVNATAAEVAEFSVRDGDFLFNTRNSRELVGKTALFEGRGTYLFNNNIMRIRFNDSVDPHYMIALFQTSFIKRQLEASKSGTTSVVAIYFKNLSNITVLVPPLPLQKDFTMYAKEIYALQAEQTATRKWLDDLFQSMLHRAFNGEL